jgi:hypothetical protein
MDSRISILMVGLDGRWNRHLRRVVTDINYVWGEILDMRTSYRYCQLFISILNTFRSQVPAVLSRIYIGVSREKVRLTGSSPEDCIFNICSLYAL